jgi:hypothetical protein
MAADFDRSLWKQATTPEGCTVWTCERPAELQDVKEEERIRRVQHLIMLPYQCSDILEQDQKFTDAQLENVWQQLQNWTPFEQLGAMKGEKDWRIPKSQTFAGFPTWEEATAKNADFVVIEKDGRAGAWDGGGALRAFGKRIQSEGIGAVRRGQPR